MSCTQRTAQEILDTWCLPEGPISVLQHPHPTLLKEASDVFQEEIIELAKISQRLVDCMTQNLGCGLALPQVGISRKAFVYAPYSRKGSAQGARILFNPILHELRENQLLIVPDDEGCLSVARGVPRTEVKRKHLIRVSYSEIERWWQWKPGKNVRVRCVENQEIFGWEARVFQHEYDHLFGIELGGADLEPMINPSGKSPDAT